MKIRPRGANISLSERNKGRDSNPYSSDRNTLSISTLAFEKGLITMSSLIVYYSRHMSRAARRPIDATPPSIQVQALHNIIPLQPIIIPIIKTQLLPHLNIPTRHKPNPRLPIITLMNTLWITIIIRWRCMIQEASP